MSHSPEYHKDNYCERRFQETGSQTSRPEPCPVCFPPPKKTESAFAGISKVGAYEHKARRRMLPRRVVDVYADDYDDPWM